MEEIIRPDGRRYIPDGSKERPFWTGVTAYADGSLPPVSGGPNLDLPSLGGMVNPAQLPPQNTPTQPQAQTGSEGYNPYQNLMDNVSSILDKATNNNQQGLKDLYLESNRPGVLGSAVRSYLVDNPIGQQNFTGYEDDNEITAKLESLAPEEQHKLALHFADQLRLNTLPRIQADANLSSQFEGNPLLLTKSIKDLGRTVDRVKNNLPLQIGSFGAMLGAGAVAGINSWLDIDDTPDSNAFERFGSSLWQLSQDLATKTQKFIDPTVSIANPTTFDVWYGNTHNMLSWGFEFAFGGELTKGVSGISSLTKYNKAHSSLAKLNVEKALASVGVKDAFKVVKDFDKYLSQGGGNSIAKFAKLTYKQAKQFTINVGKAFQHQLADLPFDAPALAVMSSGSNNTIMTGLFEEGTKRSTTPESVLNRFVENAVLDLTAGSVLLGGGKTLLEGGKTAVNSILKTIKGEGKSLPLSEDLYRPLPASAPDVQLPKNTTPQVARDIVETAQAVASHDHNNLMRSAKSDARVSRDVAKAVGNVLSKEVEATEAKPYIPGVDQEGMNLIFNRNAELDKLKAKLSNPNITTEEAQKAVKEAEYAISQMNQTAKAILQGNGGAIKRIGKTYVKAEEFTQAIENLVRTNNEGVLPTSTQKAEVAQSINYLQEIEDAGKQIQDIEAENKALAKANKLSAPVQPKDVNKLEDYAKQKKLYDATKVANKAKIKQNKETIKELKGFIEAQKRNYLLREVSSKQREIQNILQGNRQLAVENKVVANLKKANKIIAEYKTNNNVVNETPTPTAKTFEDYTQQVQKWREEVKNFSIEHPNVPKELLDLNKEIDDLISQNRDRFNLTKEQNDRVIELRAEIDELKKKLPPSETNTSSSSTKKGMTSQEIESTKNTVKWQIEGQKEVIDKLTAMTSKDKEIEVPDNDAILKAVQEFEKTDSKIRELWNIRLSTWADIIKLWKDYLNIPTKYEIISLDNPYAMASTIRDLEGNVKTKTIKHVSKLLDVPIDTLTEYVKNLDSLSAEGRVVTEAFDKAWDEKVKNTPLYERYSDSIMGIDNRVTAYRESLTFPPKKVKFDARKAELERAEQELEDLQTVLEQLNNEKPVKPKKTKKPSLLDGWDEPPLVEDEATKAIRDAIEVKEEEIKRIESKSTNPIGDLESKTKKRESLISEFDTDKITSPALGVDFNTPTKDLILPSKEEVIKDIEGLKTVNISNKSNLGRTHSVGETSIQTGEVAVEVKNFRDLVAYMAKTTSEDITKAPKTLTLDNYQNAVKQSLIADGIIGTMAKRTGRTKADIYKGLQFEITPKQGQPTLLSGGFGGRFVPSFNVLQMSSTDSSTTFLHELIHGFDTLGYFTKEERAILKKWHGFDHNNVKAMEALSYGFQEYLDTGKAPTSKLRKVFEDLKESLAQVVAHLLNHAGLFLKYGVDKPLKLTDEVSELFGRLIDDGSFKTAFKELVDKKPIPPKSVETTTPKPKSLTQALEEAGIPIKPAGRGIKTENRLYKQTPEDIKALGEILSDDELKILSKKDRRLVASEELNRLSDEQLEMLSKELDRIFDPESDDGGLLGRKLTRFYVKDSIFPASFIDEAGSVVETPRKLVELNDDLPPLYNQLNDLDIKLASGVPIADNALEVQRQAIVNQITGLLETKVGGYKIDVKKASENFYNDLRLNLPEEHQQLIPTVEADEVAIQARQNGRLKQSKIQTVRGSEWYSSLPNTKVKVEGEREYTIKGLVNTQLNKLPLEKIEKLVTDIESGKPPKPEELVNYLKGLADEKATSKKENGSIKTTNEEATTKTETKANGNTNREESLRLDKNPYGIDERFYKPGYITDNDIDNFVGNLQNTDKTPVQKQAQYQGMMDSILGRLEKAMDSDPQVNFTFMREAVEHVLYKVKGIVDIPNGKTLYTGEYSQVNLALIERILGVEGKNKVLHLLNDSAVSGEDKLIQADAIAVIATRYNNQIKTELTKIQDATGFAEISKKSDKTGESSLDRLFNAFTRLRAFEQVLTPDLLKITHDMGLYGERLSGITKELEEARKLQLPWREYEQFVGALPNIYLGKEDPSILSGVYKDENLYTKISEEMGVQPNTTLSSELKATVISTIQNTNNAYVELKDSTKKILQEMSILERNKSTSNAIMRIANNMADTSLAWSMAKLVVSTKVLALQTTGLFSSYADAMNRFVGGSALELAVGLFGKGIDADNALSTVRTAKVLAGHELLEGFWRLTKIASLAKSGYEALSLGVKRQGHPLTKRHPGDPFIEASIFKKEGNLLTKGYGALSEGANFLIQKSAFPISTIDAFMTLEAIKTNSRNELYLAVTNSDAYKNLPSKERGAYVSMMLDLHKVDESFLGIKGTSIVAPIGESTINLAQDRTFTTPMPEAWGDAIGREGLYRSVGWAVNKTTQWLTGTAVQNVPGASGVLRQSLPLFTGVLSNFSDAVARNTPGLNLTSSQGLEVASKLLPTMVGKADANVPIRELANRPEFASKYAHTMGVFVNTAFGLGALAYLGDSTDDDETFEFTTDVVNGMKAIGKSIPFVEIISEGDGEYDTVSNTYPRSIASVVIGLPNANLRWNIPIDQIPLGIGWAINIAKGWSDIEKEKIEEIKFANDTGVDPGVVGMLNDKYQRKALEVITETVKVPISFLADVTSSQLDFSQEGFGLNNVPIVKQFREVYDAFTTTNREVDTHQEWWTTRISALSTPLWSQGLSYFVALGNQKPWGGNLTTNKKMIDKLGFKRISSEAGSAIMQLPGKFDIFGNPVQVIPGFSVNNTAGVSPTISMSNQEMSRLTKLIEKADTGERKDIYKTWMKNIQYKPQIGDKRYSPEALYFQGVNGSWVINGVMRSFRLTGYNDTPGFSQYDGKTYREAIETLVNSKEYQDAPDIHTVGGVITPTQNTKDLDKFNTWAERTVQGKKTKLSLLSDVISLYQMEWDNQFKDAVDEFELIQKDEKGNPGLIPLDAESILDIEDRTNYGVKPTPYPVATPDQTSFQDDVFKANVKPFNNLNNSKSRL